MVDLMSGILMFLCYISLTVAGVYTLIDLYKSDCMIGFFLALAIILFMWSYVLSKMVQPQRGLGGWF